MPSREEIIAVIPARGGSKGVPRKNVRLLAGKPLVAHTILDAKESRYVTRTYVSTDDPQIARVSRRYGAEVVLRPSAISGDKSSSEEALLHALDAVEHEGVHPALIVFLQCTSPIRTGGDIDRAITALRKAKADALLSVVPSHRFLWEVVRGRPRSVNYDYRRRPRRQDMAPQYMENGSIYVFRPEVLRRFRNRLGGKVAISVMDEASVLEIDSLHDFKMCAEVLRMPSSGKHK